jgi:Right handed beta helix region
MHRSRVFGAVVVIGLAMVGLAGSRAAVATDGSGGNQVSWLSGFGDDANPCSRTAPCKTLAGAFSKTSQPGGEISAEDPGNFASPSNTLTAPTITGGIVVNGSPGVVTLQTSVAGIDGIDISAAADDVVILRHLDIEGFGIGLHGINFISGKALYIEDSVIQGFAGDAVHVAPAAGGQVVLDNVSIRNSGQNGVNAVGASDIAPSEVIIRNSRIEGNAGAAVLSADYANVTVDNTTLTGNEQGLACVTQSTGNCVINAASNLIDQNTTGVLSGRGVAEATGGATVNLTDNKIAANNKGLSLTTAPAHGRIISLGDNTVVNNTVSGKPTSTITKV